MPFPSPMDAMPQTAPKAFTARARAPTVTAARSLRPSFRGEIVGILREAEDGGQRMKWTGSRRSFKGVFAAGEAVSESDVITGVIGRDLVLGRSTLSDPGLGASRLHLRRETKVRNVNRLSHRPRAAAKGGGADGADRECSAKAGAKSTLESARNI